MERRIGIDRRQVHMFFANERRTGPHDRRGADARRQERARQIKKIDTIRSYKEKTRNASGVSPVSSSRRMVYVGVALLIILVIVLFAT
ncbi:hypothetical protein [Desulfosarcina ovata]|uniref:Uncharacterized protein n=1 Tax=Desulfosarcina ovata subsp. ovata TaxID=2752305 RepID=A0A5K8ACF4_9BACT|nr:hypothetical protein [Desulfosarcina ovata]BBO90148.1 hypothetical protein DSCOOX_33280 [Desulfosarcina ovata subsp. ovata]